MNKQIIMKIAIGVSALAFLFSLVTLIRACIIGSNVVFPIVQVIGSLAIFIVCFIMLRALSAGVDEDTEEADNGTEKETDDGEKQAEEAIDALYEKYHLSDFEEKEQ